MRDSDATLIVTDSGGIAASVGTSRGQQWAHQRKPLLVIDATEPNAPQRVKAWVKAQQKRFGADMTLSIGGTRESEAPGIYVRARLNFLPGRLPEMIERVGRGADRVAPKIAACSRGQP